MTAISEERETAKIIMKPITDISHCHVKCKSDKITQ